MFRYDGTGLCVPADASFRTWLNAIVTHRGTGVDCPADGRNQSPVTVGTIPAMTVKAGESVSVNASSYFSDPDGDALTYSAMSTDDGIATVGAMGSTIEVVGQAAGDATVTVTASDPEGLSAEQQVMVTVTGTGPSDASLSALSLSGVTLTPEFSSDVTAYTATVGAGIEETTVEATANSDVASVAIVPADADAATAGHQVALVVGDNTITVSVTAEDGTEMDYTVTVTRGGGDNRSPVTTGTIPARTLSPGGTATVDASGYFSDPDGDALTYSAASSNASVAGASVSGSAVTITAVAQGSATITVTARDPGGLTASQEARVTVSPGTSTSERDILEALYNATGGPNWINQDNWLTDAPLGDWHGVDTNPAGRVIKLDLERNRLAGPLPPELGNLSQLGYLSLRGNPLTGSIPTELGGLIQLTNLILGETELSGEIPGSLGQLANLQRLWIFNTSITGEIPAELGNLAALQTLSLGGNELTGNVPPELGNLSNLNDELILSDNLLTGEVPGSFRELGVYRFHWYGNQGLCVPRTGAFTGWLGTIDDTLGPFCTGGDEAALRSLYEAAGGPAWGNSTGWLSGLPLSQWYGVTVDSHGRVLEVDLRANGLVGQLTASVGDLQHVTALRIDSNPGLAGPLPLSLTRLPLRHLSYEGTGLCTPTDESFQAWLRALPSHAGTGEECVFTDRDALADLYDQTNGRNWRRSDNWLTDAPLNRWHGVTVNGDGRVVAINLTNNGLVGRIPATINRLTELREIRSP